MSVTSTDPIADMLTRIRNAIGVRKHQISLPYSKVKQTVAELLQANHYLDGVSVEGEGIDKRLVLTINPEGSNARITEIKRLSKPGRRYYANSKEIPVVKRGRGIVIVSTSQGMMTGNDARAKHVGGELICEVY